jgi:hypothetical protein
MRREPLEVRKATRASVVAKSAAGLRLNEHNEHDGAGIVFRHACKMVNVALSKPGGRGD